MTKDFAKQKLQSQIDAAQQLKTVSRKDNAFTTWRRNCEVAIEKIFPDNPRSLKDFQSVKYTPGMFSTSTPDSYFSEVHNRGIDKAVGILRSMIEEVEEYWDETDDSQLVNVQLSSPIATIQRLCDRFHVVARQLRARHADRNTLEITDEYDVQDLLHGLLKIFFDDVRAEEWTGSYAGGSSRMDFLLKNESTVVEVKKTRKGLGQREVGDQLIIDINRYQSHLDCKLLICFVYDPEGLIGNPHGLESDLSKKHNDLDVILIIEPK